MSLSDAKMPTLKQKLEEKAVLEQELAKVDEKIDEIAGEKKVKITRKSLKKAK